VNHADRQVGHHAVPDVGCERHRSREQVRREVGLDGELRVDLTAREHERATDDVVGLGGGHARDGHHGHRDRRHQTHARTLARLVPLLALGAFHLDLGQVDSAFYNWYDRKVHCAVDIDSSADNSLPSIMSGLDRAADTGEVLELYTHDPQDSGGTV